MIAPITRLPVGNAIDIDFDRVFQESIDQHRLSGRATNAIDHERSKIGRSKYSIARPPRTNEGRTRIG